MEAINLKRIWESIISVCRRARGRSSRNASEAVRGLQAVLDGSLRHFDLEYPCHAPGQKRWFWLCATPLLTPAEGALVCHIDITRHKMAEHALGKHESMLRTLVENSPDCIMLLDREGRLLFMNAGGKESMEVEDFTSVYGTPWLDFWRGENLAAARNALQAGQTGKQERLQGCCPTTKDAPRWWDVVVTPLKTQRGKLRQLLVIARNITERHYYVQQLEALASTDGLTGLYNQRTFQQHLALEVERSHRYQEPLTLLLLDIDHFKRYNDTFGHPAGNVLLVHLAQVLKDHARTADIVARYGGEEFAVILPNTDTDGGILTAEQLREAIQTINHASDVVTVSIGVASLQAHASDAPALIMQADVALYHAKTHGRNRVTSAGDL